MRLRRITFLLFTIFLTGCKTPIINTPSQSETNTPKRISTSIATAAILPTINQTSTQVPSQTPTATSIPTWTPLPTLEPTAALLYVENLLQNNGGCRLPCWWGITPGKTTWMEGRQFLESFALLLGISGNPNNNGYASFKIPYPEDMGSISHGYGIKDGDINEIIDLYNGNLTTNYNLVEMLNTYGQPDNILISAYYEPRYSEYMVEVAIFYIQQGILVIYNDNEVRTIGDKIQVCPQKATYPYLNLWSPALHMTLEEASNRYLDTKNWPAYQSLQDATGMEIESFYNTFMEKNNASCLELSTSDWPKE